MESKLVCKHEVMSGVLEGNTFWYCGKCLVELEGSLAEMPHMDGGEILQTFFEALPGNFQLK